MGAWISEFFQVLVQPYSVTPISGGKVKDLDEETGTSHMAAVVWHAFALMEFLHTHPEFDDRVKNI